MDHYAKAYPVFSKIRGFYSRRFQDMLLRLRRFSKSEVAQLRMKIIKFYEEYGRNETKKAFGVDRRLISKWRKRLKKSGGRLGCPKINAHIERYNRTIQEEFVYNNLDIIHEKNFFIKHLLIILFFITLKEYINHLIKKHQFSL